MSSSKVFFKHHWGILEGCGFGRLLKSLLDISDLYLIFSLVLAESSVVNQPLILRLDIGVNIRRSTYSDLVTLQETWLHYQYPVTLWLLLPVKQLWMLGNCHYESKASLV